MLIKGDCFTILKGFVVNNITVRTDSNGVPYTYFIINQYRFTNPQGIKEYQPIKVLAKGSFVKAFIEPYIKKDFYLEMVGDFHFKYKTNEQGFPDVNQPESYFFRLEQIWEWREPKNYNQQNQNAYNQQPNSVNQGRPQQNQNPFPTQDNQQSPQQPIRDPFSSYAPVVASMNGNPFDDIKKPDLDDDLPF